MKIVQPTSDIWGQCPTGIEKAITWIERAGRICYRSEDKIIEGSGRKFVAGIVKRTHYSVIEHSNFVVCSEKYKHPLHEMERLRNKYATPFLRFLVSNGRVYIGGNFRAWIEMLNLYTIDDLFSYFPNEELTPVYTHDEVPNRLKMITAEFLTDRAVTHELVRHRPCSFSQESQRYCAYRKHLEVLLPWYYADIPQTKDPQSMSNYQMWVQAVEYAEKSYKYLLAHGEKAEQARSVLPNSTATRIVVTATVSEWNHIFMLRTAAAAYPGIRNLINPVKQYFHEVDLT